MRIFGFEIRRSGQPPQQPTTKDAPRANEKALYRPSLYTGQQSKLITALGGSLSVMDVLGDPRSKLLTFQAMVAAFPEVARMLRIHQLIMGSPEIESDDEGFEMEANALLREIRWKEALNYEGNVKTGIDTFVSALATRVMVEGQQFYEILDAQGQQVLTSRQKIDAIRLHNSMNFEYTQNATLDYWLNYTDGVALEMNKKLTPAFQTLVIENHSEWPWGIPLLYNSASIALKAAIMEDNQIKTYQGKGSAPRVTLFGLDQTEPADANILAAEEVKEMQRQSQEKIDELTSAYTKGIANANNYGVPMDVTAGVVGKISMETHSMADNIQPVFSYPTDIKLALTRLVYAMNGEPSLVGLSSGGDGIGSNRTEILMQSMASYGKGLRQHIQPHVNRIFLQHAARLGMRLPDYKWHWEGIDTADVKAMADIEKTKADTQKVWVDALTTMTQAGEIEAAQNFAKENGLEWYVGSEPMME